jgi:hypothetical protein
METLTDCTSCRRHVRDARCPFCGAGVVLRARVRSPGRLSRFAILTGLALAGCGSSHGSDAGNEDAGYDAGLVVMPYGAPAFGAYV